MSYSVVVTGGCGFIGSHVIERLIEKGMRVVAVDDLSTGSINNLPVGTDFIHGNITDPGVIRHALKNAEIVIHLAARVTIRDSFRGLAEDVRSNVLGTAVILKELADSNVKKFIFASSMAVYGHAQCLPMGEGHLLKPISPYGIGKTACESYILNYCEHLSIQPVILRYFNTYGPRQSISPYVGVIRTFITNALQGSPLNIFGDGNQSRDFISVHDVSNATVKAVHYSGEHKVFNVGTGIGTDIRSLASMIRSLTGSKSDILFLPAHPGEPLDSVADIRLITEEMGFSSNEVLEKSILDLIEWIKKGLN